jgi:4-hydroxy-tetrahydrodipicolinate synthase
MNSNPLIYAALATPVDEEGNIHNQMLAEHCQWVMRNGCDGFVVFGTTGEAASFSISARQTALEKIVFSAPRTSKIVVGTGCCSTEDTVKLSNHAFNLGCHAVLVHPPFFFKEPSEAGIFEYYARLINGLSFPEAKIYLYHFPEMTAVPITFSLIERLLGVFPSAIAGIKDSTGDFENTKALTKRFPQLEVYTGDDHLLWPLLEVGGAGSITATANLTPNLLRDVMDGWQEDSPVAQSAQEALVGLWKNTLLKFPVMEAIKEIMADKSGNTEWRNVCPPLAELPPPRLQQLLSLIQPFEDSIPDGLGGNR